MTEQIHAFYIRVSSEEQKREGISLDAQKDKAIKWYAYKNITNYKLYTDEGKSGKAIEKRDDYNRLMSDCETGFVLSVTVVKLDRLHRNLINFLQTVNFFKSKNINFASLSENIDTSSAGGILIMQIFGALAEFGSNDAKFNTKSTLIYKAQNGDWVSGRPPYGYYDKNKYKFTTDKTGKRTKKPCELVIDEKQAENVKSVYNMIKQGDFSYRKCASELGISVSVIKGIVKSIQNKTYFGFVPFTFDGVTKIFKSKHQPILST